jgi:queuine tRNA-ribosyltransferase
MDFSIVVKDGLARAGRLRLLHGIVETPAFMPIGTYGAVKGILPDELQASGTQMILANTFHLWERPGKEIIDLHQGLHGFMQ